VDYTFRTPFSQITMHELIVNPHNHTCFSDGNARHSEIGQAALQAGLDAVLITDHNVYVDGVEKYYRNDHRQTLLLVGEEIHDQTRRPQKNHLLVFGAGCELSTLAQDTNRLLQRVRQIGGAAFIAHPVDPAAPAVGEDDISWVDWDVQGYTGIELWNGMSEFKSLLKSKIHAIFYAYNPSRVAHGPFPQVLRKWDELLSAGKRVFAIGGSDAHALPASLGFLHRTLFPYEFHYRCINTHLLVKNPLTGNLETDRKMILDALAGGQSFVGYDLPASTRGFRFTAHGFEKTAIMGEEITSERGVTIQIRLPRPAECLLIKNGKTVQTWNKHDSITFITNESGIYRVEAYLNFLGRRRGWIFSNPIFIE
jgi:hypothetical protein